MVTETVVTEAVEMGPCRQRGQPFQVPLAPLDTLCSWMDGMEELQASQGPLAADAALAASQLREQELLLRLLRERAPHTEPRLQEAGIPSELCTRWHHLVQQAETRWRLLKQLVPAAQSFETACKALLVQLGPSEQLLAELQLGPKSPKESLQNLQVWPRLGVGVCGLSQAQCLVSVHRRCVRGLRHMPKAWKGFWRLAGGWRSFSLATKLSWYEGSWMDSRSV